MEKALWPQWNLPSWFIPPTEKAWFIKFFELVIVMVKDKKIQNKRYNSSQNCMYQSRLYALHEVYKKTVTSSFRGI